MATAYEYDFAGTGNLTTVEILPTSVGTVNTKVFTGSQTFMGNIRSEDTSTGTVVIYGGLGVQGGVIANEVWGAAWNDLSDCIVVPDNTELEPGYAYCFDGQRYYKSTRCDKTHFPRWFY